MPTYVIPSFCAATAIGPTGNPTIPNMNSTPCFLRLRATSVAPSTSLMSGLLSERDHTLPGRTGGDYVPWRPMDHVAFDREPPATLTTLVVAFGGWIDAGRAATGAVRHLVRELAAERLASIDPEEFFVLIQERPEVRLRPDGEREIHWPRSEFFSWRPKDGGDGLLLFCGPEPHQRWRTYTTAFLDVATRCGVRR